MRRYREKLQRATGDRGKAGAGSTHLDCYLAFHAVMTLFMTTLCKCRIKCF